MDRADVESANSHIDGFISRGSLLINSLQSTIQIENSWQSGDEAGLMDGFIIYYYNLIYKAMEKFIGGSYEMEMSLADILGFENESDLFNKQAKVSFIIPPPVQPPTIK